MRAVIFDLDGCLVDSEPLSIAALSAELAAIGIADATFEVIRDRFLGVSMQDICDHVAERAGATFPPDFVDRVEDRLFALYRESLRPIPGAVRLLAALTGAGIPFAIATGGSVRRMTVTLRLSGLAPWFEGRAFSADEVRRGKPAPDLFLLAADRLGVPPKDCTVIEDSPHGIAGARAAGMAAIGFVGGTHLDGARRGHRTLLRKAGAKAVYRRLADVRAALLAPEAEG
ncbi:MAG: HAD family hydrolase [Albidovulum sp.]